MTIPVSASDAPSSQLTSAFPLFGGIQMETQPKLYVESQELRADVSCVGQLNSP